jgi:UDP-GlcNAc:undecaprenyl-phosphate GlcNAc-1-phosphate transferase
MITTAVAFLVSVFVSAVLTPVVRNVALRYRLVDSLAGSRKIHNRAIPRLGGVAIVTAFFTPLLALHHFRTTVGAMFYADRRLVIILLVGGAVIALLGLYDDLRGANARTKFLVQFAVAGFLYWRGLRIDHLATPFGDAIHLGVLGLPFTVLWIVGVINAVNLIDGLDGLAGGISLIAIGTIFVISLTRGEDLMMLFGGALGGAVVGFLFYNYNPATIFMGDTGSMFLGYVLATTSMRASQKSSTAVAILIPLVLLGIPIGDTLLAIGRRALRGRPLFNADREHIHHRLLAHGLSQRQAVLVLYAIAVFLGLAALLLTVANSIETAGVLVAVGLFAYLLLKRLGYISGALGSTAVVRRRNREVRAAVRRIGAKLRGAGNANAIWDAVRPFGEIIGTENLSLVVTDEDGRSATFSWQGSATESTTLTSRFTAEKGARTAQLELHWCDGRTEIDRDDEIAAEQLIAYLADALVPASRLVEPQGLLAGGSRPRA